MTATARRRTTGAGAPSQSTPPVPRPAAGGAGHGKGGGSGRSGESSLKRKALALAAFLILAASALNALFGDRGFLSLSEHRDEHRALLEEIAALERNNQALSEMIHAYRSDPLVIEKRAREVLGMAKRGEIAVTIRQAPAR